MSAQQLITEHIDLWTSSIKAKNTQGRGSSKKRELYGIKKLRELILELAVRGKLVPQDPNDEPASVLLERIAAEKEQLIKDKKIKKQKSLPGITDEEKSLDLPIGWEWARFQAIASYIQRGKGPKYADSGCAQVVSQKCIQWSGFDLEPARYIEDASLEKYQPERFLQSGDLLWNSTGTGTVGRINLLEYDEEKKLVADSHVTVIRPLIMNGTFLQAYISAPGVQSRIEPDHKAALVSGSTNQVELNTGSVIALPIPVPSISEQHRIVAKVDELMALCDQLEQQTESSLDSHNLLVDTLLSTLTDSRNADELSDNWARLADHFETLITTDYAVERLKKTTVQLAVQGNLVPQDSNDEPASELLKRIAAEKAPLIKDKKIKKQKPLPDITDEEKPFDLPTGWEWTRLGRIIEVTGGSQPPKSVFVTQATEGYTRLIQIRDFKSDNFLTYVPDKFANRPLIETDIMIGRYGPPVFQILKGKTGTYNVALMKAVPVARSLINGYLFYLLSEPKIQRLVVSESERTAGQSGVRKELIYEFPVALPPIEEQHRIVAKVDELMTLCDQLKARLNDAQTTQIRLAEAVTLMKVKALVV
jgi:type I restriction enzyme, S subunit